MDDKYWVYGLLAALVIGGVISLFASTYPDGMEKVAIDTFGGESKMEELTSGKEVVNSPMPDYMMPGIENETLAASLAAVTGVLIMFVFVVVIGKILKKRKTANT